MRPFKKLRTALAVAAGAVLIASCASSGPGEYEFVSAPQAPPGDFDTLIVPGQRVGPIAMGGYVDEITAKLGKPDRIQRSTYRDQSYDADEVYYYYDRYCTRFTFFDKGLRPVVQSGFRGIYAGCNRWALSNGIRVGSTIQDLIRVMGEPTKVHDCKSGAESECVLHYNSGVIFKTRNRNSPVYVIYIIPAGNF